MNVDLVAFLQQEQAHALSVGPPAADVTICQEAAGLHVL